MSLMRGIHVAKRLRNGYRSNGAFMSTTARKLLSEFESLGPADQRELATEILRRSTGVGDVPDAGFDELAAELFRAYEAEESGGAHH